MTDVEDRLAEIEALTNAATEGPWLVVERGAPGYVPHYGVGGGDFPASPSVVYAHTSWDGFGNGSRKSDAAFIAAARTDVPALTAALRAVLALHTDAGPSQGFTSGGYGWIDHCCAVCGSFGEYGNPYPCPTAGGIGDALGVIL